MPDIFWISYNLDGFDLVRTFAYRAGSREDAVAFAATIPGKVVSIRTEQEVPCGSCAHRATCWGSQWWDLGDGGTQTAALQSHVHTCVQCGKRVLDVLGEGEDWTRREVPDGCPRWNELTGALLLCLGCMKDEREAMQAHPKYPAFQQAISNFIDLVRRQVDGDTPSKEEREAVIRSIAKNLPTYEFDDENVQ